MSKSLFWLSDEAWAAIEPHLPHGKPGKPRVDDRTVISGICRPKDRMPVAGCAACLRPADHRLQSLSSLVATPHLATCLREDGGSRSRAGRALHRQHPRQGASFGSGLKRGAWTQAIGTSRGGRTSKIHCLADDHGRPVAFALTPGNVADITMAIPLLKTMTPPKRLLADKAYDADSLRNWLKRARIKAVIPSSAARRTPYPLDRKAYRRRNVIERMFCKLKNWRRVATRYDRLAQNYLSAIALAAIISAWC